MDDRDENADCHQVDALSDSDAATHEQRHPGGQIMDDLSNNLREQAGLQVDDLPENILEFMYLAADGLDAQAAKIGQLRQLIGDALERGGCGSSMWAEDATAALDEKPSRD